MIDKLSDLDIVHVSDSKKISEMRRWCIEKNLREGEHYEFYGKSSKPEKIAWAFMDRDMAMLFKLTFGG